MKLNIQLFASKNVTMSGDSRYYITLEVKETSYSTANNTSNVSYSLKATKKSGSGYYSNNAKNPIKVTINGSVKADTKKTYDFTGSTPKTITLASGTVNGIQHTADGSKTILCSASFTDKDNSLGSASVSFNLTLTKINRGATLTFSSNPIALGETLGIDIDINSGGSAPSMYTYNDLYVKINNVLVDTIYGDIDSATWTPPLNLASYFPNSSSGTCTITCETYEQLPGSQEKTIIGTSQPYTLNLTIPNSVQPSVSIGTPVETNAPMISKNWGVFVEGKSQVKIPVNVAGIYGSSINSVSTSVNGINVPGNYDADNDVWNFTTNANTSGTNTISSSATDSRTNTGTDTDTFNVVAYSNPILDANCEVRWDTPDAQQSKIRYDCKGSISSVNNNNAKTFKLKYKKSTETTYQEATIGTSYTIDTTNQLLNVTLDTDYSYDFKFEATDSFTTTSIDRELDTGFDLMNFNSNFKAMAIGKVSEAGVNEEKLEIALPTEISEDVTMVDGAKIVGYQKQLTAGTNITIDANNVISASGGGGGTATDVQINGTTITSNNVANIVTQSTYNASTNKIATKSDIPTLTSQLTNNSGYITNSVSNLTNYTKTSDLSSVATSGSYNDLSNKPTIPTVNNATLTIQKNGTTVKTFTANASSNVTANITVPTKTSDLTNDDYVVKDSSYVHTDNNYTTTEKNKLSGIASGAEVNVQSNWNETNTSSDAYIQNKPTIPTKTSELTNDSKYQTLNNIANDIKFNTISSILPRTGDGYDVVDNAELHKNSSGRAYININSIKYDDGNNYTDLKTVIDGKQPTLISGTNIKTINNNSIVGSGNLSLDVITTITTSSVILSNLSTGYYRLPTGCSILPFSDESAIYTTNKNALLSVDNNSTNLVIHFWLIDNYTDNINWGEDLKITHGVVHIEDGLWEINTTSFADFVKDSNYVHTDNNYTTTEKNKLAGISVNNGTLTIQKNGTNVQTFTANQSSNVTANITIPTKTSELTNNSGYISSSQSTVGSTDKPIYLNNGTPTQTNTPTSGNYFRGVPFVTSGGVMEIGRYIDFHPTNDSTLDFNKRIDAGTGTTARTLTLPDKSGTLAITDDIPTNTSQLTNDSNYLVNSSTYVNTHPENNPVIIPFIHNDIAFLNQRGGSYVVKYDGTTQEQNINNVFDASPSYWAINPTGTTEIVIELTLHKSFAWTNSIYYDFGSASWRAKNIKVEVMNSNYASDTWVTKQNLTNYGKGNGFVTTSHIPVGASNAGAGFNKIRFTFSGWQTATGFRIAQLGVYNYGSLGVRETYMSRGRDDEIYRNITPTYNNTYDLGTSSKKWKDVYATTFTGDLNGTAKYAIRDNVGNIITDTYYKASNPNGYTSNTGTITGIKMNGASKGTSGVVDLGTVLTSHQSIKTINNTSLVGSGNVAVQPTLVSGTNIKTINGTSLLGSGNISVGGSGTPTTVKINGASITSNNVADIKTNGTYNASTNKIATMSDLEDLIYYKPGDIIELGDNAVPGLYVTNGYITGSAKSVIITFSVPKRLDNISSITVNKLKVEARGGSGYLNSQSGYVEYVGKSGYTITAWVSSSNSISIQIGKSSAFSNISNNTLVSIAGYIKFTLN